MNRGSHARWEPRVRSRPYAACDAVELEPMLGQFAVLAISFVEGRAAWCTVVWPAWWVAASAGLPAASARASVAAAIGTLGPIKGILVSLASPH